MSLVTFRVVGYAGTSVDALVYDGGVRVLLYLIRGYDESWETRGTDVVVPSAHGRTRQGRKRDFLTIELEGWVLGTGTDDAAQRADLRSALDSLKALFSNTAEPDTLVIELEDGSQASIEAAPVNFATASPTQGDHHPVVRQVSIQLEAIGEPWAAVPS